MTERRTGWRKAGAAAALAWALLIPASAAYAQQPTPRPAPTATRAAVSAAPRGGEPVQDATLIAVVLGVMVVGGLTLRRFAERRA
jgi:hypothetical protein